MKILIMTMSLFVTTMAFSQSNGAENKRMCLEKCGAIEDKTESVICSKKCINTEVTGPHGVEGSAEKQCYQNCLMSINSPDPEKYCKNKCHSNVTKPSEKCPAGAKCDTHNTKCDPGKKCGNHKPKVLIDPQLTGCEKNDGKTITCPDGVYVRTKSINDESVMKEINKRAIEGLNSESNSKQ